MSHVDLQAHSEATPPLTKRQKLDDCAETTGAAMTAARPPDQSTLPHTNILGLVDHELHGARTTNAGSASETQYQKLPDTQSLAQIAEDLSKSKPLLVQLLSGHAKTPTRGSVGAAGYDLYCAHPTIVPARGKALVSTGIAIAVPFGTYGRVAPRSGLAVKHSISTGAGVIDADYRGEVRVLLFNHSDDDFHVATGDRIAQLVLERIVTPDVVCVQTLEATIRGADGFGSTGGFGHGTNERRDN